MKNKNLKKYLFREQYNKNNTGIAVCERYVTDHNPLHWHNYLELELIISGSGEQILNGQEMQLGRGSLSVMRLTDFHQVSPKDNLHLINLMIDDKIITEEMLAKITAADTMFFNLDEEETCAFEMLFRL